MADQNSEDTRIPAGPRRDARPFIGPGGAPGQRSGALRPGVHLQRPVRGPFVPAAPPNRGTLGEPHAGDLASLAPVESAPIPTIANAPELATAMPSTPDAPELATAMPSTSDMQAPIPDVYAPVPDVQAPVEAAAWWAPADDEAAATPTTDSAVDGTPYDRFAAFDATPHEAIADTTVAAGPAGASLDVSSLGSPSGNEQLWAEDIAAEDGLASGTDANTPSWLVDAVDASALETPPGPPSTESTAELVTDVVTSGPAADIAFEASGLTPDGTWTEEAIVPSADIVVASHAPAERHMTPGAPTSVGTAGNTAAENWPDQLLAEYAPYLPAPLLPAVAGSDPTAGQAAVEPRPEEIETSSLADASDVGTADRVRITSALNRLADRIRDGEIDVSSIAPDASDAAVLASLLAALLGGGSSSSR